MPSIGGLLCVLGVYMPIDTHPLESFFHQVLRSAYETDLGMRDPEMTAYIAHMLCEFSEPGNVLRLRDATGRRLKDLPEMVRAADPVHGTATSFDAERSVRKYIGDYALFMAGMYHDVLQSGSNPQASGPTLGNLILTGKESYFIVSQFNVFEYAKAAPLFARLADRFEHCVLGLAMVRDKLGGQLMLRLTED
jgi:hypothetical protein